MNPSPTTALSQLSETEWRQFVQGAQDRLAQWRRTRQGHLTLTPPHEPRRCA
ncbi:hypothetical protein [Deinococcus petrolearius]|uniref:Uncharacterized protein n=1 Tax=Deinococcus petrolearius TaxID=1751295 RepID=A0ABW1DQD1_9DEIO